MIWNLDAAHSSVTFSAKHMMISTVRGSMRIRDFDLEFDPDDPSRSRVRVALDVVSIDTGQAGRDEHLRSADFLDAAHHPVIEFVSTRVEGNGTSGRIHGDLTIRGTSRPVVLETEYAGMVPDMRGGHRIAFAASTRVNREDFGLTWNVALEQGGWLVSRDIGIEIEIAAVAATEEQTAAA